MLELQCPTEMLYSKPCAVWSCHRLLAKQIVILFLQSLDVNLSTAKLMKTNILVHKNKHKIIYITVEVLPGMSQKITGECVSKIKLHRKCSLILIYTVFKIQLTCKVSSMH